MGWEIQHLEGGGIVVSKGSELRDLTTLLITCSPPRDLDVEILWGLPWRGEDYYHPGYRLGLGVSASGYADNLLEDFGDWGDMYPFVSNGERFLATRFYYGPGTLDELRRFAVFRVEVSYPDGVTAAHAVFMTEGLNDAIDEAQWDC